MVSAGLPASKVQGAPAALGQASAQQVALASQWNQDYTTRALGIVLGYTTWEDAPPEVCATKKVL